jgi:hypothetical protein
MKQMRNIQNIWSENLKGRDHSEDLGVDGRIDWILEKCGGKVRTGCIWLRLVAVTCEHSNEPSISIIGGEFIDLVIISFSRMTQVHGVS